MNPGILNRIITFKQATSYKDVYGGTTPVIVDVLVTRAAKYPVRNNNQLMVEAGVNVLDAMFAFIIRHRGNFMPDKSMTINTVDEVFTIHGVTSYQPGVSTSFQSNQEDKVYHDKRYIYIIATKQDGVTPYNSLGMYLQNDSAVSLTEPQLNAEYPTAKHSWVIFLPNANLKYTKMDDSPTGEWDESPYNPAIG